MTANAWPVFDKLNMLGGLFVATFAFLFGKYWILFVGFLILNCFDYISGMMKAYLNKKSNSVKGLEGIVKKLGYWMLVALAFGVSVIFKTLGDAVNIDLGVSMMIGYMTLGTLILNECRSILENFVEAGYHPPKVLINGLKVASKVIGDEEEMENEDK